AKYGFAVYPSDPSALLDDSIDSRQPEARPFSLLFGCEEGLEDVDLGLGVHPVACITHGKHDVFSGRRWRVSTGIFVIHGEIPGFDDEFSAVRHRVSSIDRQVQDDLLDLTRVGPDQP